MIIPADDAKLGGIRHPVDLQLFAGEKTESATPKKRQESRKKGQVAKSMELPGALVLLFVFLAFTALGGFFKTHYAKLFTMVFNDFLLTDVTVPNVTSLFGSLMQESLVLLMPIFGVAVLFAFLGNYLQIGFLFTGDPLMMKFSKLNPVQGAKKIFGLRSLVDFMKSILKITVIGAVVYMTYAANKSRLMDLAAMPLSDSFGFVAGITVQLGIKIGVLLVVISALDYAYQKYEYEKDLKMSKQDIKDEYKKSEGDPLVKGKIKERQRKMAMQRMMQEVPKADVVITNPTHFAIAVVYDAGQMDAPRVIAKGKDYVAQKIKQIAGEHGIALMENKPLARALYDQVEIGEAIPADLFQAVAEVLAFVYKTKGRAN